MSEKEIAIKVTGVGKTFQPQSSSGTIKQAFIGLGRKILRKHKKIHQKGEYTALKDISFDINKGDFFGIVGKNGSGKSTLLKILAGVYTPTKGTVQINGKLTPFIELGVGFNPELSGRDNVFLNGSLLGFTRKQMEEMYDDIVDFAELHEFMDTKLKNYSSGMQVRLAFSVAIRAESDILLIDEVLAVGDASFQQKCVNYFESLKKMNKTVILVSHDRNVISSYCDRALLLEDTRIVSIGSPDSVLMNYDKQTLSSLSIKEKFAKKPKPTKSKTIDIYKKIIFSKNKININEDPPIFKPNDLIGIEFKTRFYEDAISPIYGFTIRDKNSNDVVFATNTKTCKYRTNNVKKGENITIKVYIHNKFSNGSYLVSVAVANKSGLIMYDMKENVASFNSIGWLNSFGKIQIDHEINIGTE